MDTIGADIVLKTLAEEGVDVIFGYPGANTLPLNDRMADSPIRHYLMRHEQAAAHAADGYARATGKVGVCLSTSGPGATNLVTGIATAYMDSTPMVAITAQVDSDLWGRDAFQETDIIGITMPITKHSFMVRDVNQLASSLRQAFQLASTGRTGPVLVDIPKDILSARCGEQPKKTQTAAAEAHREPEQLERIAQALNRSERPVLIIGGGVKLGDACAQMSELVQTGAAPLRHDDDGDRLGLLRERLQPRLHRHARQRTGQPDRSTSPTSSSPSAPASRSGAPPSSRSSPRSPPSPRSTSTPPPSERTSRWISPTWGISRRRLRSSSP